jgi:dTDP-glucose pyrophosphorylase
MLNVVIPMAGLGSRFAKAGYDLPKPFVDVNGAPMIERVLENLSYPGMRCLLLARREHVERYPHHVASIRSKFPVEFIIIDGVTEGAACTVLFARKYFANETPLLLANCDQIIDGGAAAMIDDCRARDLDGSVMVFKNVARNRKWSFVRLDVEGFVVEAREKQPISDLATVGLYMFSRGVDFLDAAIEMIIRNERVNGEFYTCPVYNALVAWKRKIGVYEIAPEAMHGIGTPEDLDLYLKHASA